MPAGFYGFIQDRDTRRSLRLENRTPLRIAVEILRFNVLISIVWWWRSNSSWGSMSLPRATMPACIVRSGFVFLVQRRLRRHRPINHPH